MKELSTLRVSYKLSALNEKDIQKNPFKQFEIWINEAISSDFIEPNAMTLATCSKNGRPSARMVLLKSFSEKGFSFYTNYESRKAAELESNPYAALVFWWDKLQRQIRIEGIISRIKETESDYYYSTRPTGSQLGAWVSPQSKEIESRDILEKNLENYSKKFKGKQIKRPGFWGGYILKPESIEFWQGRENRLSDRLKFIRQSDKSWKLIRLAP